MYQQKNSLLLAEDELPSMPPSAIGNSFVLISPPDCPLYLNNLDLGDGPKYFLHLYKLQFIQCNNTGHNCQRFLGRTQKYM